jgi:murein L,D-transpeptidase YafK
MKTPMLPLLIIISTLVSFTDFKSEQLQNARVKTAYSEKEERVKTLLSAQGITQPHLFIQAFKKEQVVELWAKNDTDREYQLITQYDFCATSGTLGPKRRQGDWQIPEGFYHIDRFNPWSSFYLSLGINYPNASDRILGHRPSLGGDIFIHGDCVTIGCIPLTDEKIKEVYVFAVEAKNNGQRKIPVYLFPSRMEDGYLEQLTEDGTAHTEHTAFWNNLQTGYHYFQRNKTLPKITVLSDGKYHFE